jgi:hypothetical protein
VRARSISNYFQLFFNAIARPDLKEDVFNEALNVFGRLLLSSNRHNQFAQSVSAMPVARWRDAVRTGPVIVAASGSRLLCR